MRDTRKNKAYFEELVIDFEEALTETQEALDAGNFSTPSSKVDISLRLFQLSIMRAVTLYSYGVSLEILKPYVLAILPFRQQLTIYADKLPAAHQPYRYAFEQLGEAGAACGSENINRYIYTLWWLSLLKACDVEQSHINDALNIVGERGKDKLLDYIALDLGDVNRPVSTKLYYPEVYKPLSDAFEASKNEQVKLLNRFMINWYDGLEAADWHDNHKCDLEFEYTDYYIGYWSLEHALVANLLNIPKKKLEQHPMVAFDLIQNEVAPLKIKNKLSDLLEDLPDINRLTLQDVASFTLKNNPSEQFKEKWGDEYFSRAMSLWRGVKECYSKSEEYNFTAQELLFVMSYEYAVAPYSSENNDAIEFYKWCFENLNEKQG